ncbi:MAG: hypothetical protein IPL33_13570 [Sphingobacteriales bacterium]|nr:hypothetical protein [Sphingobacteriales bacterium]MCC7225032.1 hypothetical protein [Chitinophagales bacterium]
MRPFIILLGIVCFVNTTYIAGQTPAFPGAEGFGANATGGRGGQVIYVTNLNCNGPGSLNEALAVPGAKYILFKVSGVIQCAAQVLYGDVTLAGQTSPGGIIVRGLVVDEIYEPEGTGNNIIVRHLRSRPQNPDTYPGTGWILDDGLRLDGAQDIIVDHCSFANALDEATQISNSQNISIQYCQLAETIGYHYIYGGMLINYSEPDHPQQNISIHHNVWNRIGGRFPEISCESPYCNAYPLNIELSNNLLWDINTTLWYGANIDPSGEDYSFFVHLNFINNYAVGRATYTEAMAASSLLNYPQNQLFSSDNRLNLYPSYADYDLFYCCNDFNLYNPNTDLGIATILSTPHSFPAITYQATNNLQAHLSQRVGAFPRDSMDRRLLASVQNNTINPSPLSDLEFVTTSDAFLLDADTPQAPQDTDNDGMPNYWETAHSLNNSLQDHNNTNLSVSITGIPGYTNLECYLNCLADALVNGGSSPECGIQLANCTFAPNITGTALACNNQLQTYSVEAIAGSTYVWTVTGGTILNGQGTHQIVVQWSNETLGTVNILQTTP